MLINMIGTTRVTPDNFIINRRWDRNRKKLLKAIFSKLQNVMDGDLCEQYTSLDPVKQKSIASDLGRTPNEVAKKLEDIRTRYAF
jgi:hypothetical protein